MSRFSGQALPALYTYRSMRMGSISCAAGGRSWCVKFFQLPKLIIPSGGVPQAGQPRPLAKCPSCRYVLCSCGRCHSEECLQPCLYEGSGSIGGGEVRALKYYRDCAFCSTKECQGH